MDHCVEIETHQCAEVSGWPIVLEVENGPQYGLGGIAHCAEMEDGPLYVDEETAH